MHLRSCLRVMENRKLKWNVIYGEVSGWLEMNVAMHISTGGKVEVYLEVMLTSEGKKYGASMVCHTKTSAKLVFTPDSICIRNLNNMFFGIWWFHWECTCTHNETGWNSAHLCGGAKYACWAVSSIKKHQIQVVFQLKISYSLWWKN